MSIKSLNDEDVRSLENNFSRVRENIRSVSEAGREVTLLAATKTVDVDVINYAIDNLGLTDIGENRVQELLSKYDRYHLENCRLHFIGRLQTNKVKYIIDKVSMIHSLDSEKLAKEIEKQASAHGITMPVLIEINVGNEESKGGISENDAESFLAFLKTLPHVAAKGIMVIPPDCRDDRLYERYFKTAKSIADRLFPKEEPILSMGMTDSYIPAMRSGSNLVRIGSGLFGLRDY